MLASHMIIQHGVRYDRSGRRLEPADDEDLAAVRPTQQHRHRHCQAGDGWQQQMLVPFRSKTPPPDGAGPDVVVVSSDSDDEEGATQCKDMTQFVSAWVHRWPSRAPRSMVDQFVDVEADDR